MRVECGGGGEGERANVMEVVCINIYINRLIMVVGAKNYVLKILRAAQKFQNTATVDALVMKQS